MTYQPKDRGAEQLVYNGTATELPLQGPSAQLLTLPLNAVKQIQWAPTDRRVQDVEVRAAVVSFDKGAIPPTDHNDPYVRWRVDVGHGKYVWTEPPYHFPANKGALTGMYMLPARGLIMRATTRELRLTLKFEGNFKALNFTNVTVSVSFQPVTAMTLPAYARESGCLVGLTNDIQLFPQESSEWRMFDMFGQPFVAGVAVDVYLYDITGRLMNNGAPIDRSKLASFIPITPRMYGWGIDLAGVTPPGSDPMLVQYR
jgi:hypothetical protein